MPLAIGERLAKNSPRGLRCVSSVHIKRWLSSAAAKPGRRWSPNRILVLLLLPRRVLLLSKLCLPSCLPTLTSPSKSTANSSKRPMAYRCPPPVSAGPLSGSVCRSKKDTLRLRARGAGERALAREGSSKTDPERLLFVDESVGCTLRWWCAATTRERPKKGERAYGSVPPNRPRQEHHAGCFALARGDRRSDDL